jgi:polyisoprenoid-binding protein YceI
MHGVTRPVTLDVDVIGIGPEGPGARRAGFEARTRVNRQDFGVAWNDVAEGGGLMVGDDVEITISIEAMRPPKPVPAEKGSSY